MRKVQTYYTFHCSLKRDWNQWVLIFFKFNDPTLSAIVIYILYTFILYT